MQTEIEQLLEIPESDIHQWDPRLDELIEAITETNQLLSVAIDNQRRHGELLDQLIARKADHRNSVPT